MIIFPAVDIKNGRCVRLYQGKADKQTIYNDDPLLAAKKWEDSGAKYLHLVDLDGAFIGELKNKDIIKRIAKKLNIPIQVGGGIRTLERAKELLSLGVERIIVGTSAVKEKDFVDKLVEELGDRVVVSIDTKDGYVCVDGWVNTSSIKAVDFAIELEEKGIKTIVYTDISKDGTMVGPNFDEIKKLKKSVCIDIIASGGIGCKEHLDELRKLDIYGAIVGKALYEGRISLEEL